MTKTKKIILKNLLKTLSNKHKVFDFNKIREQGYPINIIISERGSKGKTFGMKEFLREDFLKNGNKGMLLMNSINQVDREKKTFIDDFFKKSSLEMLPISTPEFWKNCTWDGSSQKATLELLYDDGQKKQTFIKMLPITHGEKIKGSRGEYTTLVYDEFNVGISRASQQCDNFFSVLHTLENVVIEKQPLKNIFIFGNNKSLNNLILIKLGITHINDEITQIYDEYGKPLILIIVPKFTKEQAKEIKEKNKNNWIYQLSSKAGDLDHAYLNQSLNDSINNVKQWNNDDNFQVNYKPIACIYTQKRYYSIGFYNGRKYVIPLTKRPDGYIYSLNKRDMIEGNVFAPHYKEDLLKMLSNNELFFSDVVARESIIKIITI